MIGELDEAPARGDRMSRRSGNAARFAVNWLILDRRGRLVAMCVIWLAVLVVLAFVADPLVWLGLLLGALLPASIWIAWEGLTIPRNPRLDYFLALTPREFEETVARLIVPLGFTEVRVVGGAADLGVDVLCRDREGRRVAIQCKRYQADNEVSSSQVQTFMGGMVAHRAQRGIIVTTSSFSAPARDLARDHGIRLIDGAELSRMLAEEEARLGRD
jgi:restriction system protein